MVSRKDLIYFKHLALEIEKFFAKDGNRQLNIDPGLITPSNLILSTTKGYAHRIYLGMGVYAEVTLIAGNKGYYTLPWTYPDYKDPENIDFFNKARRKLLKTLRNISSQLQSELLKNNR